MELYYVKTPCKYDSNFLVETKYIERFKEDYDEFELEQMEFEKITLIDYEEISA